jgi:hypothetical protein
MKSNSQRWDHRSRAKGAGPGKGEYKPGTTWLRRKDGAEFVLKEKDEKGLVFRGYTGHFAETAFRPK